MDSIRVNCVNDFFEDSKYTCYNMDSIRINCVYDFFEDSKYHTNFPSLVQH